MRVNVNINHEKMKINETFTGGDAEAIVNAMKARVAREANFAIRLMINAASPLMFAQEVVKRYNDSKNKDIPIPNSCADFLKLAEREGFATIEEN
jgi:hypothetical protein